MISIGIGGIDNYCIVLPVSSDCRVTCDYHVISTAGFVYLGVTLKAGESKCCDEMRNGKWLL